MPGTEAVFACVRSSFYMLCESIRVVVSKVDSCVPYPVCVFCGSGFLTSGKLQVQRYNIEKAMSRVEVIFLLFTVIPSY